MILLTTAVSFKSLKPSCQDGVCSKASTLQIAFFYSSLYIIAIGSGGTKPNISTFGADQFDDFDPHEKELKVSFFNWWMFSAFLGCFICHSRTCLHSRELGMGLGLWYPNGWTSFLLICLLLWDPILQAQS